MPQKIKPNDSFAYEVLPVVEEISAGWLATSFVVSMPRIVRCCLEIRIRIHKRKMPKAIG